MAKTIPNGTRVNIKAKGHWDDQQWGIVTGFDGEHYHVAMRGGKETQPIFARSELVVDTVTLSKVNREIARQGGTETLVKGYGYFYFINCGARRVPSSGVMVYRINQLTVEQWLLELAKKRAENKS